MIKLLDVLERNGLSALVDVARSAVEHFEPEQASETPQTPLGSRSDGHLEIVAQAVSEVLDRAIRLSKASRTLLTEMRDAERPEGLVPMFIVDRVELLNPGSGIAPIDLVSVSREDVLRTLLVTWRSAVDAFDGETDFEELPREH